jgi:hypothetical protein
LNPFLSSSLVTVAAPSKAPNVFARSNTGILVRILLEAWISVRLSSVFVFALRRGWSPVRGVLPTIYRIHRYRLILMWNRPQGLIRKVQDESLLCFSSNNLRSGEWLWNFI